MSTRLNVESLMTQTLIIHVIWTSLIPFIQSRASWQLTVTPTTVIMAFALSALFRLYTHAEARPLPPVLAYLLVNMPICYGFALIAAIKAQLARRGWI